MHFISHLSQAAAANAFRPLLAIIALQLCLEASPVAAAHSESFPMKTALTLDLPTPGVAVAVAWSRDGSTLAAASDYGGVLTVWDKTGRLLNQIRRAGGGPTLWGSIAFANGSSQLVFPPPQDAKNGDSFSVWDISTGKIIRTEIGPQPDGDYPLNRAQQFATSPDQTLLAVATGGNRGTKDLQKNVISYDPRTWNVIYTKKVLPGIGSLCVFADGKLIGVGSMSSGLVSILDAKTGDTVRELSAYPDSEYGFFSVGAIAGGPSADLVFVGIGAGVLSGKYSSTAEQRAWDTAMSSTNAAQIIRLKDGAKIASFDVAKAPIRHASWDPQGRFVAFVDHSSGLFLWAPWASSGYLRLDLPSPALSVAVSPDGRRVAVTTDHGVRVYSVI
jgi:WD40 repeat protein